MSSKFSFYESHFAEIEITIAPDKGWVGEVIISKRISRAGGEKMKAKKANKKPFPSGTSWYGDTEFEVIKHKKAL